MAFMHLPWVGTMLGAGDITLKNRRGKHLAFIQLIVRGERKA